VAHVHGELDAEALFFAHGQLRRDLPQRRGDPGDRRQDLPLPEGAILVKENYMHATDPMPMALTVMSKQGGKWYWVEQMPDGSAVVDDAMGTPLEGTNVQMCIGCHSTQSANDDVYTHSFK
jgi:hypothetical protein